MCGQKRGQFEREQDCKVVPRSHVILTSRPGMQGYLFPVYRWEH